jgi:hypothetical protein
VGRVRLASAAAIAGGILGVGTLTAMFGWVGDGPGVEHDLHWLAHLLGAPTSAALIVAVLGIRAVEGRYLGRLGRTAIVAVVASFALGLVSASMIGWAGGVQGDVDSVLYRSGHRIGDLATFGLPAHLVMSWAIASRAKNLPHWSGWLPFAAAPLAVAVGVVAGAGGADGGTALVIVLAAPSLQYIVWGITLRHEVARTTARPTRRLLPLWTAIAGLLIGVLWGGLARLWMRAITTERPDFSWDGTIFILGVFAVAGMTAGLVFGARRRRWRGAPIAAARVLGCGTTLTLSAGQGALMAPTLVFGGLAIARRSWPTWLRTILAILAITPPAIVHQGLLDGWPHGPARFIAAIVLVTVVYGGAAVGLAQSYAPLPDAPLPHQMRWAILLLPVLVLSTVGVPNAIEASAVRPVLVAVILVAVLAHQRRHRRTPSP